MIAKIYSPKADMKHSIDYNFNKIEDKKGVILGGNIGEEFQNKDALQSYFHEIISENKDIRSKDKNIRHISISLKEGEFLDNDTFMQLAERYLEGMGLGDNPMMVFRHHDTDKEHIHILVSQVDFEGVRVPDSNERYRSKELSRVIEKEFDLEEVDISKAAQTTEDVLLANRYSCSKLIQKLPKEELEQYKNKYKNLDFNSIRSLSNKDIKLQLGNKMQTLLEDLNVSLPYGVEKLKKESLIETLDDYRNSSKDGKEFIQKVENDNSLYIRTVYDKKGHQSYVFGKVGEVYLKEGQYPPRFNMYAVTTLNQKTEQQTDKAQKKYLRTLVTRAVRESSSIEDLQAALLEKGIKLDLVKSKNGKINGVNFTSLNVDNPITFKGSALHKSLSYANISQSLETPKETTQQVLSQFPLSDEQFNSYTKSTEFEKEYDDSISMPSGSQIFYSDDNDELEKWNRKNKKKKKKGKKR